MLSLIVKAIGIIAPGINSWQDAISAFSQPGQFNAQPIEKKLETLLPANERRRAAWVTQLALFAAQQTGDNDFSDCLQVFSSSNGDVTTFHQISTALGMEGRPVSPTRFHNSVHNAPAGYWSIATGSQTASTSLTAFSDSFSAGLLEAAVQLNASDNDQNHDCLLVCYDEQPPASFESVIDISEPFACALRLTNDRHLSNKNNDHSLARLELSLLNEQKQETTMSHDQLETLRQSNPQARVLPLLSAIASEQQTSIYLPYFEQTLAITIIPSNS